MEAVKKIFRPYYVRLFHIWITNRALIINFFKDYQLYKKYSTILQKSSLENKEADLVINYHSLEKGMLFKEMKNGFGRHRVENLHKLLNDTDIISHLNQSQIKVAFQIMCKYYELHREKGFDISSFYTEKQYEAYKIVLKTAYSKDFQGVINFTYSDFYQNIHTPFEIFAQTRKSVRNFTGQYVSRDLIDKAVSLAMTSPSVCNRQASKVYLLEDKSKIDAVLKIQAGFTGYNEKVSQLLILTNDRSYYYTVGERNQLYIDGGIFLMNLLYALHFYKIANCPANWGKTIKEENALKNIILLPESEKIICIIPIGIAENEFRVTLSQRRSLSEVLKTI